MRISPSRLTILTGVMIFTVILYCIYHSTSSSSSSPQHSSLKPRLKHVNAYEIVEGSSIESLFYSLQIHKCSDTLRPKEIHIWWNNKFWQQVGNAKIYLYSAYYDSRYVYSGSEYHYVRIIGMAKGKIKNKEKDKLYYCSLWYVGAEGRLVVKAEVTEVWLEQWNSNPHPDTYHTYLFTCPVPLEMRNRKAYMGAVSVTSQVCSNVTNLLVVHTAGLENLHEEHWKEARQKENKKRIREKEVNKENQQKEKETKHGQKGNKKQFAVCVKGMDFSHDVSLRLIEWLELLIILGADKVFMYKYTVHKGVEKVLKYYSSKGVVDVIPLTLPGDQPNEPKLRSSYLKKNMWQKRRNELVPYNDCLYRNIYHYDFIMPLDIDEIIIPVKAYTWSELLTHILQENPKILSKYASLSAQNAYFLGVFNSTRDSSLPKHFHMFRNTVRSANFSLPGHSVKSFVSTVNSRTVFNHYTLESLYPKIKSNQVLNTSLVQMNHYKERCPREMYSQCKSNFLVFTKEDDIIYKYRKELVPKVEAVIKAISIKTP